MTIDKGSKEWRELTFSQREGKAELPEQLQAGELTIKFKNLVWLAIGRSINNCSEFRSWEETYFDETTEAKYWENCYTSYQVEIVGMPYDEIGGAAPGVVSNWIKDLIFKVDPDKTLTLLEHLLRFKGIQKRLTNAISECFEWAPYLIDTSSQPVCIIPVTSNEMKEIVSQSLGRINESDLSGAKTHLHLAAQALSSKKFADTIRESIHAVESAARTIDPEASKTLGPALDSLEKNGILKHPALKGAFQKLYGYTSDTEGIRHPLIKKDDSDVGFDEAIFMYAACVSFVDYLVSKKKQMDE